MVTFVFVDDVVGFVIWGHGADYFSGTVGMSNVTIYIHAGASYSSGAVCASGVTSPDSRGAYTVLCSASVRGAKYVTLYKYVAAASTDIYLFVNELQPLRQGE